MLVLQVLDAMLGTTANVAHGMVEIIDKGNKIEAIT